MKNIIRLIFLCFLLTGCAAVNSELNTASGAWCDTCKNKRFIPCDICWGGKTLNGLTCWKCEGLGKLPCPVCQKEAYNKNQVKQPPRIAIIKPQEKPKVEEPIIIEPKKEKETVEGDVKIIIAK